MPIRDPERRTPLTSTPKPRNSRIAASPMSFLGKAEMNPAFSPKPASETATLASPPPNVASNNGDCRNRSCPGDSTAARFPQMRDTRYDHPRTFAAVARVVLPGH
jgi:hypothetical protein